VRAPSADDRREPSWRLLDADLDNIEKPASGTDYDASYPQDTTTLYYWRSTYWRKQAKPEGASI
jgi:hypothetical protein